MSAIAQAKTDGRNAGSYKDLVVWQNGIRLVKQIYQITGDFPASEKYGLTSQMQRAAVSIPSNVAEGQAHHTTKEFILSISHAEGSAGEMETQLIIAMELGYCDSATVQPVLNAVDEMRKMLHALHNKLLTHH